MTDDNKLRAEFRAMSHDALVRLAVSLASGLDQNAEAARCARWIIIAQFALWCVWLA